MTTAVSQNPLQGKGGCHISRHVLIPTKWRSPPPLKQVVEEGKASLESNQINVSPTAAPYSSHSESPTAMA